MTTISNRQNVVAVVDDQFIFDAMPSLVGTSIRTPRHPIQAESNRFVTYGRPTTPALNVISGGLKFTRTSKS